MELDFMMTLSQVLILFLLIVIGFIAGKAGLITVQGQQAVTQLVLYITMPATIFRAMQLPLEPERVRTSLIIIGVMVLCYTVMFTAGALISKRLNLSLGQKDVFHVALMLSNTTFMGYPIVASLLGQEALFYSVLGAGFIFEIVSWTLGIYLVARHSKIESSFNLKKIILSPGIISIIVGLIFFITQWQLPTIAQSVVNTLAPATSPLAMIVVGLILSRTNIKEPFQNKYIYLASAMKLVVVPVILIFVIKGLVGAFNLPIEALVIPVIMISMPTASYVAMFAGNYDNNPGFASQIVFMSSLLSIITIPLITLLL